MRSKLEQRFIIAPYNARVVERLCRRLASHFECDAGYFLMKLFSEIAVQNAIIGTMPACSPEHYTGGNTPWEYPDNVRLTNISVPDGY